MLFALNIHDVAAMVGRTTRQRSHPVALQHHRSLDRRPLPAIDVPAAGGSYLLAVMEQAASE